MGKYALVVFSNPTAGKEDEYNAWYTNEHLKDVVSIPGYVAAQRFKTIIPMMGEFHHRYLAIYDMDAEDQAGVDAALKALTTTPMAISDALDSEGILGGVFEVYSPHVTSPSGKASGRCRMIAMGDSAPGRDAEFNSWYNSVHLQEVTSVPGFTSADRYKLLAAIGGQFANNYLAVYGMEADTPEVAGAALQALVGAGLQQTDTSRSEGTTVFVVEVISDKVTASKEKALA
jgi:hypothetical protein